MNKKILQTCLVVLAAGLISVAAVGQESSSSGPVLLPAPDEQGISLAPNFRVAAFRLEPTEVDQGPDPAPDSPSEDSGKREGLVKRSVIRIGEDQKRLYEGPFERHNLKWDALVLVGTGAFLATDRRIEKHISSAHFTFYQATSDIAIAGLSATLGGIYIYGLKGDNHPHARETGDLELETLVNTFLIYTPMQLIFARQRPGEGNGKGDFFKHHMINTSFPGGHAMFTFAMASVVADEYPKTWARILAYGSATIVTVTRFMARDHWASDMFLGAALGTAIAEKTFHERCNPELPSQCKHHQWWWKAMKIPQ